MSASHSKTGSHLTPAKEVRALELAPNNQTKIRLSHQLKTSLDAARGLAAFYVVIHHVALTHNVPWPLTIFRHFGHQAVVVFFLLSGFVIFANEKHRLLSDPMGYYWRRVRRIYPTLICAMAISTLVALMDGNLAEKFNVASFAATLLGQQDLLAATPGTISDPYLGNLPLWSLSYEILFYLIFPFALWYWTRAPRLASVVVGIISSCSYGLYIHIHIHALLPIAYFASWWLGAMIADAYGRGARSISAVFLPCASLLLVCLVAAVPVACHRGENQYYPVLQLNHLTSALLFGVLLFGPVGRYLVHVIAPFQDSARAVASVSYGVYVLHYPILTTWSFAHTAAGFPVAAAILLGLSWLTDAGVLLGLQKIGSRQRLA